MSSPFTRSKNAITAAICPSYIRALVTEPLRNSYYDSSGYAAGPIILFEERIKLKMYNL